MTYGCSNLMHGEHKIIRPSFLFPLYSLSQFSSISTVTLFPFLHFTLSLHFIFLQSHRFSLHFTPLHFHRPSLSFTPFHYHLPSSLPLFLFSFKLSLLPLSLFTPIVPLNIVPPLFLFTLYSSSLPSLLFILDSFSLSSSLFTPIVPLYI
jgi:hypothetical protein